MNLLTVFLQQVVEYNEHFVKGLAVIGAAICMGVSVRTSFRSRVCCW